MAPTETYENAHSLTRFILPDLISDCQYPLRVNPHCRDVSHASEQWLLQGAQLVEPYATIFIGLKGASLASYCYPDADEFHLRVCSDFLNWAFIMDDRLIDSEVTDAMGVRESCIGAFRDPIHFETKKLSALMCKSFFGRAIQTAGPGCTKRFIDGMNLHFVSAAKEFDDHAHGRTLDLKSYIAARRDTSGCMACFALIEFAARIDLPDQVMSHPVIMALEEAANDFISWSNDVFSFNIEQSQRHTYNLVVVLMHEQGLDIQGAVDSAYALCKGAIQRFEDNRAILPSWGEELDKQVAIYIDGLQNWMVGALHSSFVTERYFGKEALEVKQHRVVELLPKRPL